MFKNPIPNVQNAGYSREILEGMVAFSGVVKLGGITNVTQSASNSLSLTSIFIYMTNFVLIKKILFNLLLKEISGTSFQYQFQNRYQ